jgi:hypothetical protein
MARLFITSALATVALAGASPVFANTSDALTTAPSTDTTSAPAPVTEKLRAKLTEDGYKDITILPTTYAVSATDKNGKPVLLLIGPGSSTVLPGDDTPSQAESPDGAKKEMQQ